MSKAKDPAVLWYYRDYLSGTEELAWAEQGAYARLLNKQADKGHLSLDTIRKILKKDFPLLWPPISEKFKIDDGGNYYNERMDIEVAKRAKNSQAQKDRINRYWEEQRNNHGTTDDDTAVDTTEYSTDKPIANANASKKNIGATNPLPSGIVPDMLSYFRQVFPNYPADQDNDFPACFSIAGKISSSKNWTDNEMIGPKRAELLKEWRSVVDFVACDVWYKKQSITMLAKKWQDLIQSKNAGVQELSSKQSTPTLAQQVLEARKKHGSPAA